MTIEIDGKSVSFKISALLPRIYRNKFGSDMIVDMNNLRSHYCDMLSTSIDGAEPKELSAEDLQAFLNIAYIAAKHADETITDDPDEWIDGFGEEFTVYNIYPILLDLWIANENTTSTPKKRVRPSTRESTGATFMLRCCELGLTADDLKNMTMGMVADMLIEKANDAEEYPTKATNEDIKQFFG